MRQVLISRYYPPGCERLTAGNLEIVRYLSNGRPCVLIYHGKSYRASIHQLFATVERREEFIAGRLVADEQAKAHKAERRAEQSKPHSIPVGAVIVNSWGYDQTNIDFYQVVKVTANNVYIRSISQQTTEEGFMQGPTVPLIGQFVEAAKTERHRAYSDNTVHFEYGAGFVWNGKPERCSWYA